MNTPLKYMSCVVSCLLLTSLCAPSSLWAFDGLRIIEHDEVPSSIGKPVIFKLNFSLLDQAPETQRRAAFGFGLGLELARWFGETSYGSLVGVELVAGLQGLSERKTDDGEDGETYGHFELHPRLALALIPPREDRAVSLSLLAGYMVAGWQDYWWDEEGVRQQISLGARLGVTGKMLEYVYVRPTAGINPPMLVRDGFRRVEHRTALRLMGGEDMYGYAFTFHYHHGVIRASSLDSPLIDRQFMFSAGFYYDAF